MLDFSRHVAVIVARDERVQPQASDNICTVFDAPGAVVLFVLYIMNLILRISDRQSFHYQLILKSPHLYAVCIP